MADGAARTRGLQPLTRLLALLIVAPSLGGLPLLDLTVLTLLLLAGYRHSSPAALPRLRFGIGRLRWLLLSILVLYLGFTPGEPLTAWTPGFSREGLLEGSRRVLVLLSLVTAVYWLMATTPVPQLVGAFDQLLRPLRICRVPTERFTRRLALTLAALDGVEARYRALRADGQGGLALASAWIAGLEQQPPGDDATAVGCAVPARWEWLLLLLLLLAVLTWPR